ncbi:hypothetical protein IH979_01380 [Patescibacteria group bacterium]|nr:hypothetical protein [Patescibacteria group bacterium]
MSTSKNPTIKQTIAAQQTARAIVEQRPISKAEILKQSGYSEKIQRNPNRVFDTDGFKEELNKYLPLDKVVKVHGELLDSEQDAVRLRAAKLGYEVHGVKGVAGGTGYYAFLQQINVSAK